MTEKKAEQRAAKRNAAVEAMNALARRIWAGQSASLSPTERVARIKRALTAKGYAADLKKLSLPVDEKYL